MTRPENKRGLVAATTKGPSIHYEANANWSYPFNYGTGKPLEAEEFAHSTRARAYCAIKCPESDDKGVSGRDLAVVTCRDSAGRKWAYRGKRARVVEMLATMPDGLTQWDALPWHTRLGGTIHALRQDGLEISTELEGPDRHARYRLHSPVRVIEQADNRQGGGVSAPGKK